MQIGRIGAMQNFKGGKLYIGQNKGIDLRDVQIYSDSYGKNVTPDTFNNPKYYMEDTYIREKGGKGTYYDKVILDIKADPDEAIDTIEKVKKLPGSNNILDLRDTTPILKLEGENKAYYVEPQGKFIERKGQVIGWSK